MSWQSYNFPALRLGNMSSAIYAIERALYERSIIWDADCAHRATGKDNFADLRRLYSLAVDLRNSVASGMWIDPEALMRLKPDWYARCSSGYPVAFLSPGPYLLTWPKACTVAGGDPIPLLAGILGVNGAVRYAETRLWPRRPAVLLRLFYRIINQLYIKFETSSKFNLGVFSPHRYRWGGVSRTRNADYYKVYADKNGATQQYSYDKMERTWAQRAADVSQMWGLSVDYQWIGHDGDYFRFGKFFRYVKSGENYGSFSAKMEALWIWGESPTPDIEPSHEYPRDEDGLVGVHPFGVVREYDGGIYCNDFDGTLTGTVTVRRRRWKPGFYAATAQDDPCPTVMAWETTGIALPEEESFNFSWSPSTATGTEKMLALDREIRALDCWEPPDMTLPSDHPNPGPYLEDSWYPRCFVASQSRYFIDVSISSNSYDSMVFKRQNYDYLDI